VDIDFVRPRYRAVPRINLAADSLPVAVEKKQPISTVLEDVPITKKHFTPKQIDYMAGAKAFRKKRLLTGLYSTTVKALFIMAVFALIIMVAGLLINRKYQGRALPLTYVGDVAIGGMTPAQIKGTLDEHYGSMMVTFVDGGLVKKATIDQLGIKLDTAAVGQQAVPKRFNPFSFLNWQRYEVPVEINDRIVAGYMQTKFNSSKTKSEDAQIGIDKNKLKVFSELVGFQADNNNIVQQIKYALARADEPRINVNAVTVKPRVNALDLTDDFNRANAMLQTSITIKYGYTNIRPTLKQKMAWLELNQVPGSKYVDIDFSRGMIRTFILEEVKKIQSFQTAVDTTADAAGNDNKNVLVIENIDETADAVIASLKSTSALNQKLTIKQINSDNTIGANQTSSGQVASIDIGR
jgi:hypothetical protein